MGNTSIVVSLQVIEEGLIITMKKGSVFMEVFPNQISLPNSKERINI